MKHLLIITIFITIGLTNNLQANPCKWDANDSARLHSLYQYGTHSQRNHYIRWRRAEMNSCNNKTINPNWIMNLHYKTDKEITQ